jgi:hypothetical protein
MTSNAIIFQIGAIVMKKKQIHAGLSPLISSNPQSSSPHSRPLCLSVLQRHPLHPLFSSYDSLIFSARLRGFFPSFLHSNIFATSLALRRPLSRRYAFALPCSLDINSHILSMFRPGAGWVRAEVSAAAGSSHDLGRQTILVAAGSSHDLGNRQY